MYISTAYSSPHDNTIQTEVFKLKDPIQLLRNLTGVNDLSHMYNFPNTYTFSKCITENILFTSKYSSLPLTIIRPSIVASSIQKPYPGWYNNLSTYMMMIVSIMKNTDSTIARLLTKYYMKLRILPKQDLGSMWVLMRAAKYFSEQRLGDSVYNNMI